jgi:hypothetical protein
MGFWPAKTLLSAVKLDVFTTLEQDTLTGEDLGNCLDLHERGFLIRWWRWASYSEMVMAPPPATAIRLKPVYL